MSALKALAHTLGGDVAGDHVLAPGPGHSPRDRSMAVWLDDGTPSGVRVHSFANDDYRDCLDYVRQRLGGGTAWHVSTPPETPRRREVPTDNTARALELWDAARSPGGTPVETYLAGRGITLPDDVRRADVLRLHEACPFRLDDGTTARLPALVALMRDIITDEPVGIHRTALKPDGSGKADLPGLGNPKKMLGRAKGAAIKLSADEDVTDGLGIAEGIETALSIMAAGWRPMWALGSAGTIASFPVLPGIECLTIFADADRAGLAAAQACQGRWRAAGRECPIVLPPHDGTDWNDWRMAR